MGVLRRGWGGDGSSSVPKQAWHSEARLQGRLPAALHPSCSIGSGLCGHGSALQHDPKADGRGLRAPPISGHPPWGGGPPWQHGGSRCICELPCVAPSGNGSPGN